MWSLLIVLAALVGLLAGRRRKRGKLPASAVILSPRKSTVTASDGAVRSVQSAELTVPRDQLTQLWTVPNLENLARTYWLFLTRVTLGVIRVVYGENERSVVFLARPFTLLRFTAPEYVVERDHGKVIWRIESGLLVARAGRGCGYLALDVQRLGEPNDSDKGKVRIDVEVENFYPAIASGFSMPVYEATQSAIHVLVTHAFLRSLARLKLARSKVGRLRWLNGAQAVATAAARARRSVTHRDGHPEAPQPERRGTTQP
jgi:hypothetical protein